MPTRLRPLDSLVLSPEQRGMHDVFAAAFPAVRGPWAIALRNPDVADLVYRMYDRLCPQTTLGADRLELMILVIARRYTAQYVWFIHERLAREHGIPEALIQAIRRRQPLPFERVADRLTVDVTTELLDTWTLGDATYARALEALGEERLVEFVTAVGFYAMLAMQVNVFAAAIPAGVPPLD